MAGLNSGMNACVSGLKGISQRVNCHTQNIAAAGAYASKQRAAFLSVINSGTSLNSFIPGGITATNQHFVTTVGSPVQSDVDTHMSLGGQGFFVVKNGAGDVAYTRVGTFSEDKDGIFRNHVGDELQVFAVDAAGVPTATNTTNITSLQTATTSGLSGNPVATTSATIKGVLSAQDPVGTTQQMSMDIYDSLGILHTVNLTFAKTAVTPNNIWSVTASTPASDPTTIGAPYNAGMTIQFDSSGNPSLINGAAAPAPNLPITWSGAAAASTLTMNFGTIGQNDGLRCVGNTYDLPQPTVDGRGAGKYEKTSIDEDGYMVATYDNGTSQRYARIPLATFPDANKLTEKTGGSFASTGDSGPYTLSFVNQGKAGSIVASSLEESTIDTAGVFTDLIVDQQRYTANLKGISTIKEMLQSLERALA